MLPTTSSLLSTYTDTGPLAYEVLPVTPKKKQKTGGNDNLYPYLPTDLLLKIFLMNGALWCCHLNQLNKNWTAIATPFSSNIKMQKMSLVKLNEMTTQRQVSKEKRNIFLESKYFFVSIQIGFDRTLNFLENEFNKLSTIGVYSLQYKKQIKFFVICENFLKKWLKINCELILDRLKTIKNNDFKKSIITFLLEYTTKHISIEKKFSETGTCYNSNHHLLSISRLIIGLTDYWPKANDHINNTVKALIKEKHFFEAAELAVKNQNNISCDIFKKIIKSQLKIDYIGAKKIMHSITHLLSSKTKLEIDLLFIKKLASENFDQILSYIECFEIENNKYLALATIIEEIALQNYPKAIEIINMDNVCINTNRQSIVERVVLTLTPISIREAKEILIYVSQKFSIHISHEKTLRLFFKTLAKENLAEAVQVFNKYTSYFSENQSHICFFEFNFNSIFELENAIECVKHVESESLRNKLYETLYSAAIDLAVQKSLELKGIDAYFNFISEDFTKNIIFEELSKFLKSTNDQFKRIDKFERVRKILSHYMLTYRKFRHIESLEEEVRFYELISDVDYDNLNRTMKIIKLESKCFEHNVNLNILTGLVSFSVEKAIDFLMMNIIPWTARFSKDEIFSYFSIILKYDGLDYSGIKNLITLFKPTFLSLQIYETILLEAIEIEVNRNVENALELQRELTNYPDSLLESHLTLISQDGFGGDLSKFYI